MTSVIVERDDYEKIILNLPYGTTFGDKVREWMTKEIESFEMEKKGNAQTDPLNLNRRSLISFRDTTNIRTLDLYIVSQKDVNDHFNNLENKDDFDSIRMLREKATQVFSVAKTKINYKNNPKLKQQKWVNV